SELIARIHAILRRTDSAGIAVLRANDLVMDVVHRTVRRGDKTIDLSPREFSLLEYFLRNKNRILTRKRIAEQVWGYTFETGTNVVDVYVSYVREAVDKGFSQKLIYTVHGEGFLLKDE
ncbi:MAG: winged helix-turn-helix domain-containing protein, partial [Bacteroidota bacterium]